MKKLRSYLAAASVRLGLPMDIAAGLPHLEVNGFRECSVDRHTGIRAVHREPDRRGKRAGDPADAPGTADDHRADRLSDLR